MHKTIHIFIAVLITIASSVYAVDINSGHSHPVECFYTLGNTLYTGDSNGTLRIWDTQTGSLSKRLQISFLPAKVIAVNAEGSKLAVVETDAISIYKLSVWDLTTDTKLYTRRLSEIPMFLKFSPTGNYIVYGKTDWNGLRFLDAEHGFNVPLISEDYGIASSVYLTESEKTLMFYSPSGTIQYWNLVTGEIKTAPIKTRRDLSSINMTSSGAYMTGTDGSSLYMINLQNGRTVHTEPLPDIISSVMDQQKSELAILRRSGSGYEVSVWRISVSSVFTGLRKINSFEVEKDIRPATGLAFTNNRIYTAGPGGGLYYAQTAEGRNRVFSRNIMASVSGLSIASNEMLLASDKQVVSIKSDLFSMGTIPESDSDISVDLYNNPFREATGVTAGPAQDFYLYPVDSKKGELRKESFGSFSLFSDEFNSPLISAEYSGNKFITLEKDGTCRIIDYYTGKTEFSYSSFGIRSLVPVLDGNLIAGRNRTAFLQTPLIHLNTKTSEIVPIEESNILIFDMGYDPASRTLYTLGFEERRSGLMTVLKAHSGRSYELTETLLTYPGEDQSGCFVVDPDKSRIYLSIGNTGLNMYAWDGFTAMEDSGHVPEELYVHDDLLVSLNTDSSVSIWNTDTGKFLINIYLLFNGEWFMKTSDGETIMSDNVQEYLSY